MPIPRKPGETPRQYRARVIQHEMDKGTPQKQAVAIGYSMSGEDKKKMKKKMKKGRMM